MSTLSPAPEPTIHWSSVSIDELDTEFWSAWDALRQRNLVSFINSATWLQNWISVFWQDNWRLEVDVARVDGQIKAILPFYSQPSLKRLQAPRLYLLGQGEPEAAGVASEYLDILCDKTTQNNTLSYLRSKIRKQRYSELRANALMQDSLLCAALSPWLKQADIRFTTRYQQSLDNSDILASLSKNTRNRYKRFNNQKDRQQAQIRWLDDKEVITAWAQLKAMHQQRWQAKGKAGAFCHPKFEQFHLALQSQSAQHWYMSGLFIGEKAVALNYYYASENTLHFYQSGWDQAHCQDLSPGLNLHIWSLLHKPLANYDFMMGAQQSSYKEKMSNKKTPMLNLVLALSWQSKALLRLKKIKRLALTQLAKHRGRSEAK